MKQDPRRAFSVPVEVRRSDGSSEVGYAVDLSPRGLCLLRFASPPGGPVVVTTGELVWTGHEGRVDGARRFWETGVHLADLPEPARAALASFANQPIDRRR